MSHAEFLEITKVLMMSIRRSNRCFPTLLMNEFVFEFWMKSVLKDIDYYWQYFYEGADYNRLLNTFYVILSEDKARLHSAITYGDGTEDIEALTKKCELTRKTCKGFEESRKQIIEIDSPQIVLEIKKKRWFITYQLLENIQIDKNLALKKLAKLFDFYGSVFAVQESDQF